MVNSLHSQSIVYIHKSFIHHLGLNPELFLEKLRDVCKVGSLFGQHGLKWAIDLELFIDVMFCVCRYGYESCLL